MIGCDGGGSIVRKGIGAQFEGDAVIQRGQSTFIRAPGLGDVLAEPAALWQLLRHRRRGALGGA